MECVHKSDELDESYWFFQDTSEGIFLEEINDNVRIGL